jgi:hypothetical protein
VAIVHREIAYSVLISSDGAAVMHIFTHSFDYIVLGILVACMLVAAAKAIPRRNS